MASKKWLIILSCLFLFGLSSCSTRRQAPSVDKGSTSLLETLEEVGGTANAVKLPDDQLKVDQEVQLEQARREEEEDGYMRIVGELRWDKLTSIDSWQAKFPGCLVQPSLDPGMPKAKSDSKCNLVEIGGMTAGPDAVRFANNARTQSGSMTAFVAFELADMAALRAFRQAIEGKYPQSPNGSNCSPFTCWSFSSTDPVAYARPTSHAISLMDGIEVDSSKL